MPTHVLEPYKDWVIREKDLNHAVYVKCPDCGLIGKLAQDVDSKGRVTPGLSCPTIGCHFEGDVVLKGWRPNRAATDGEMFLLQIPLLADRELDALREQNQKIKEGRP